jgi:hypothetical protein
MDALREEVKLHAGLTPPVTVQLRQTDTTTPKGAAPSDGSDLTASPTDVQDLVADTSANGICSGPCPSTTSPISETGPDGTLYVVDRSSCIPESRAASLSNV